MSIEAPKLELVEVSETTITVTFVPSPSTTSYELNWKEYQQNWENHGKSAPISTEGKPEGKPVQEDAVELQPQTTYSVRLIALDADGNKGEPGKPLIVDTEAHPCGRLFR
uniref:Fibronectin type-III domain-containing protein n=1 Tax=Helicotheca tamesis TaxID=374047 RepID=A0A7S2HC50_9STRA|mmetsp:Transcript_16901/g.23175  ORF Transcript_16901/g.23175 Transcript_16901/m.23175 type:complete len:110 (+) Transcript_16901:154-483(+)|eukprot:CAMPEP_0185735788 /NCGR_PEP_ID=MMETSP1171-20130828/26241_1 /TAXON_ID=374046 /ORGANISM="Helicotheca tamensis, Strain CCMP826" /LENGTH=109 /DNA_ID=CAMNT_0028406217 /DNA_START=77 /DNA_END=406 /DNA_ORIENTATION=+